MKMRRMQPGGRRQKRLATVGFVIMTQRPPQLVPLSDGRIR